MNVRVRSEAGDHDGVLGSATSEVVVTQRSTSVGPSIGTPILDEFNVGDERLEFRQLPDFLLPTVDARRHRVLPAVGVNLRQSHVHFMLTFREISDLSGVTMPGKRVSLALIAGGLAACGAAVAQMYPPGAAEGVPGEELYQACGFCHGAQGQGRQRLDAPALAGMEAWYIERQAHNFDTGMRGTHADDLPGRQMALITGMFRNDATIKNVAAYIETLTPGGPLESRPNGVLFPLERPFEWESQYAELTSPEPADAAAGQATFQVTCALCHGADALGNEALGGNKLTDLPDWYVARQLKYFRDGIRGGGSGDVFGMQMAAMAKLLADDQAIANIIAYIDTL